MTVAVLMYHATDQNEDDFWNVPLDKFRDQIDTLIDSGVSFIRFAQTSDRSLIASDVKHVAVTFDDGHKSNAKAWEILNARGIRPTTFMVSNWIETGIGHLGDNYMRSADVKSLREIADFGAHGRLHVALSKLNDRDLAIELEESRLFLEDLVQEEVRTMSLPGGDSSPAVLGAAIEHGFELIGNSIFDIQWRSSPSVNRLTITSSHDSRFPAVMVNRGNAYWAARRAYVASRSWARAQVSLPRKILAGRA